MEIQIDKNWKITARPLNIELNKLTKKKNGDTGWAVVGYYQKMEHALDRLVGQLPTTKVRGLADNQPWLISVIRLLTETLSGWLIAAR